MNDHVPGLSWAEIISLWGAFFAVGVVLLGLAVKWGAMNKAATRMGNDIEFHSRRLSDIEKQADSDRLAAERRSEQNRLDLEQFKTHVAQDYVRSPDLGRMEDRLAKRFEALEHTVRNTMAQMISLARGDQERPRI